MLIEVQIKLTIRGMVSLAGSGMGKVEKRDEEEDEEEQRHPYEGICDQRYWWIGVAKVVKRRTALDRDILRKYLGQWSDPLKIHLKQFQFAECIFSSSFSLVGKLFVGVGSGSCKIWKQCNQWDNSRYRIKVCVHCAPGKVYASQPLKPTLSRSCASA